MTFREFPEQRETPGAAQTLQEARVIAPNDNGQVNEQHRQRRSDINKKEFHRSPFFGPVRPQ
jgi:hypothetical protein